MPRRFSSRVGEYAAKFILSLGIEVDILVLGAEGGIGGVLLSPDGVDLAGSPPLPSVVLPVLEFHADL